MKEAFATQNNDLIFDPSELRMSLLHTAEQTGEPAAQYIDGLSDQEEAARLRGMIAELDAFVIFDTGVEVERSGIAELFTVRDIIEMSNRIQSYLGMDWDSFHSSDPEPRRDYPALVEKLGRYFYTTDNSVVDFGSFERRHTDPTGPKATGPKQENQRALAEHASRRIIAELKNFHGLDIPITLKGPKVKDQSLSLVSCPGVAECQFLILDYARDRLARNSAPVSPEVSVRSMSLEDIGANIETLLAAKNTILARTANTSDVLVGEIQSTYGSLEALLELTYYRGVPDQPMFLRKPIYAEEIINKLLTLFANVEIIEQAVPTQAEIPEIE